MGKKRDIDRLGHMLLKFSAVELADTVKQHLKDMANAKTPKEKGRSALNTIEKMTDGMKLIGSIMSKAENAKEFSFSKKDANEMSVSDICKNMNISVEDFNFEEEEDVESLINDAAQGIAEKIGIDPDSIVVGKLDGNSDVMKEILAAIKKHKGRK